MVGLNPGLLQQLHLAIRRSITNWLDHIHFMRDTTSVSEPESDDAWMRMNFGRLDPDPDPGGQK
jgi:hypothetical protein